MTQAMKHLKPAGLAAALCGVIWFGCESTAEPAPTSFVAFKSNEHPIDFGDDYVIDREKTFLQNDTLFFEISHGGGCKRHDYEVRLNRVENFTAWVFINHEGNDDLCEAWLTSDLKSDLSDLLVRDDFEGLVLMLPDNSELILR